MKKISIILLLILVSITANAQQNLFAAQNIESPTVDAKGRVTFRLIAPNAKKVQVAGDFVKADPKNPAGGIVGTGLVDCKKQGDSLWVYTSKPLPSELYNYVFVVDGVAHTDPNNVHVYRDFATISNVFLVPGGQADLYAVHKVPHGTLRARWYYSDLLRMERRINIYTPAGYEANPTKRYPVLYLLHGMGGDEDEWVHFGRACQILDNLIAQGKAEPMIVVFTNGHAGMQAAPGESSWGYYKPHYLPHGTMDGEFETAFPEVVTFVDKYYRTKADKDHRAIAGLSMGGFHSIYISANNPQLFSYVGMFSAAIGVMPGTMKNPIYQNMDQKINNLYNTGLKLLWTGIGTEDFLYKNNKAFRERLDKAGHKYTYVETGDGHVWKNWRIYLSQFAPLLFK
uniref:alpha/beta hydrolase-fold protein n=1 Tax=Prevotella sp. TaxID=59823 RepID=UPI00402A56AB